MKYRADRIVRDNVKYRDEIGIAIRKKYAENLTTKQCCYIREFSWVHDICSLLVDIAGRFPGETIINIK